MYSPQFAKFVISLIKDRTANSTVIAKLDETIWAGSAISEARLPTDTTTSRAASGVISTVIIATSFAPLESFASLHPATLVTAVVVTQFAAVLHYRAETQLAVVPQPVAAPHSAVVTAC